MITLFKSIPHQNCVSFKIVLTNSWHMNCPLHAYYTSLHCEAFHNILNVIKSHSTMELCTIQCLCCIQEHHVVLLLHISCYSCHWLVFQRYKQKGCDGDEWCPYPWYPVPLPPEGQQSDQTNRRTEANASPNGNIGKKNLIRPKPGKTWVFMLRFFEISDFNSYH